MAGRNSASSTDKLVDLLIVLFVLALIGGGIWFGLSKAGVFDPAETEEPAVDDVFDCDQEQVLGFVNFTTVDLTVEKGDFVTARIEVTNLEYATIRKVIVNSVEYTSFTTSDDGDALLLELPAGQAISQLTYTLNSISYSMCESEKVLQPTQLNQFQVTVTGNIPLFQTIAVTKSIYEDGNDVLVILTFNDVENLETVTIDEVTYYVGTHFTVVPGNQAIQIPISISEVGDHTITLDSFEFNNGVQLVGTDVLTMNTVPVRLVNAEPNLVSVAPQSATITNPADAVLLLTFDEADHVYQIVIDGTTYTLGTDFTITEGSEVIEITISGLAVGVHSFTVSSVVYLNGFQQVSVPFTEDNTASVTVN
jgi:hypothetical protein